MTNTYQKSVCALCGRLTSSNGLAKTAHFRRHVREGYFIEIPYAMPPDFRRTKKNFEIKKYQAENKGPKDFRFRYYETQFQLKNNDMH